MGKKKIKEKILAAIAEHDAKFIDLRFTDMCRTHHITIPTSMVDDDFIDYGKMFDGSSIPGWQEIHKSDLALIPDTDSIWLDPFYQDNTLILNCTVLDPQTMQGYTRDPRLIAKSAEKWLISTGIADVAHFGPEPEFFIFADAKWETTMNRCRYELDSEEANWNSGKSYDEGNIGHRPGVKGGYFPVPPVDSLQDIRSSICMILENLGIAVEAHHHEVATGGQCEVATRFDTLVAKADQMQILKYVVHNVAHNYGKTATFMPKPLVGDNGNGMHCHQSLMKDGVNLFAGDKYGGLSETALYYIGGIIHHARALNAFTNPGINSYRRLVPGFEAPVLLAYSSRNRSAAIRIPYAPNPKARRIEVRFPDPIANPYLAFAAMLMAGVDGIRNKRLPGQPSDHDLYEMSPHELRDIPTVCSSLEEALSALRADSAFLLEGDVFTEDFLESYIHQKSREVSLFRTLVHPYEFERYYSL